MNETRYLHNNGLATHDGKNWTMCEGYDGERTTFPLRVSIPQRDVKFIKKDITIPKTIDLALKRKTLDSSAVDLYEAGYSITDIAETYRQERRTVKQFLKKEGVLL